MLNDDQSREYNRDKALSEFFAGNSTVIATFQPFADQVGDFAANLAAFDSVAPLKNTGSTGITTSKDTLKEKVAKLGWVICSKAYAYALLSNNESLAAQTNFSDRDVLRLKDADVKSFALGIQSALTPLLADAAFVPYQVTATDLLGLVTAATDFNAVIGSAKATENTGRVANKDINAAISKIHGNIKQFDLLIHHFDDANPDFVAGYEFNSTISNVGIRHTGIHGVITGKVNGEIIAGATVKIKGTDIIAVSDSTGYYTISGLATSEITVVCGANGFTSVDTSFHTRRGRNLELNIEL